MQNKGENRVNFDLKKKELDKVNVICKKNSYTRYTRAFCQTGLPSTLATAC